MLKKQHIKRKSTMKAFLLYCTLNCWIFVVVGSVTKLTLHYSYNFNYIGWNIISFIFYFLRDKYRGKYMDSQIVNEI